jgi:hypothetical protein
LRFPHLLSAIALAAMLVCLVVGCGGGGGSSSADAGQAGCPKGKSVLPLVPEAPAWWKEGRGPTLALACVKDRFHGNAVIVGFASPDEGACVTVYNLRARLSHGEICVFEDQGGWTDFFCEEGPGCVVGFVHEPGFTQLAGPVEPEVHEIRVLVGGKPLRQGVALARVQGPIVRRMHAVEPFGFFVVFVPGCVLPRNVKVELLDANESQVGTAREFSGPVGGCHRGRQGRKSNSGRS